MLHALLISILAVPILLDETLVKDKIFGYTWYSGTVLSITTGYFLWDIGICVYFMSLHGPGFALHAIFCFVIYLLSMKPIFHWYGGLFLFYELSTLFLNVHWFCDKTGWTGSRLQIVNGIILIHVFFIVRIVGGYYYSYQYFQQVFERFNDIPYHLFVIYAVANFALNGLNAFWFFKMIKSVIARIQGKQLDDRGTDSALKKLNRKNK